MKQFHLFDIEGHVIKLRVCCIVYCMQVTLLWDLYSKLRAFHTNFGTFSTSSAFLHRTLWKQLQYHKQGTITPIDFVKKTLFPYSNDHFDEFISHGIISDVFKYVNGDCPLTFKPNFEIDDSKEGSLKVLRWVSLFVTKMATVILLCILQGYYWQIVTYITGVNNWILAPLAPSSHWVWVY